MTLRDIRYQAAIVVDGRVLLLRCEPHRGEPYWLLPGGGREPDESEVECVAREVLEEAGVHVDVVGMLYDIPAQPADGTYQRWRTYLCRVTSGDVVPGGGEGSAELTAAYWLTLDRPETWEPELLIDPFLEPQLQRIRHAVSGHVGARDA